MRRTDRYSLMTRRSCDLVFDTTKVTVGAGLVRRDARAAAMLVTISALLQSFQHEAATSVCVRSRCFHGCCYLVVHSRPRAFDLRIRTPIAYSRRGPSPPLFGPHRSADVRRGPWRPQHGVRLLSLPRSCDLLRCVGGSYRCTRTSEWRPLARLTWGGEEGADLRSCCYHGC